MATYLSDLSAEQRAELVENFDGLIAANMRLGLKAGDAFYAAMLENKLSYAAWLEQKKLSPRGELAKPSAQQSASSNNSSATTAASSATKEKEHTFEVVVTELITTGKPATEAVRQSVNKFPDLHREWRKRGCPMWSTAVNATGTTSTTKDTFIDVCRALHAGGLSRIKSIESAIRAEPKLYQTYLENPVEIFE